MKTVFNRCHHFRLTEISLLFIAASMTLAGCDIFSKDDDNGLPDDGIIRSVVKAPVAPDGNVAAEVTDLVLNFDIPMDPKVAGLALEAGDEIRVMLPEAFERTSDLPLLDIFACLGQNLQCDTAVLLVGWPQGALGAPPPLGYEVQYEDSHTILFTATEDLAANQGLKQIHLLLNNFRNPSPGEYEIGVEVTTAAGVEHGVGRARILAETQPSIEETNAFHTNFANGNFQETSPDSLTLFPFDFLLWDSEGLPMEGVTIENNQLMQGSEVIGQVSIEVPEGASGQEVFMEEPSTSVNAPVTGIPAGHLRAFFRAGSSTGEYTVTFELDAGNTAEMVVRVQ